MVADSVGDLLVAAESWGGSDFGGGVLSSGGSTDFIVAKLAAADGGHVWSRAFDAGTANVRAVTDGDDNLILAGRFTDSVDFGGGQQQSVGGTDVLVVKLDGSSGDLRWCKTFAGEGGDGAAGVTVDSGGNVLLTGYVEGTIDFGGGPISGDYFGSGGFLAMLDGATGDHLWSVTFESLGDLEGRAVAIGGDGAMVVTGTFLGLVDFGGDALLNSGSDDDVFLAKLTLP